MDRSMTPRRESPARLIPIRAFIAGGRQHWTLWAGIMILFAGLACNGFSATRQVSDAPAASGPGNPGAGFPVPTATEIPTATPSPTPTPAAFSLQVDGPVQTTIDVQPGQYVWVQAAGEITLGFFVGSTGPDGRDSALLAGYSTVPDLPHGALLCRIGTDPWQVCGADHELHPTGTGLLAFTVNDDDRGNNSGYFDVQVLVSPYSVRQVQLSATAMPETQAGTADSDSAAAVLQKDSTLSCLAMAGKYITTGTLSNSSRRPIDVQVSLIVNEDASYFGGSSQSVRIEPGQTVEITLTGPDIPDPYANAPPDNPDTPEYEPDLWLQMYGSHQYSCDLQVEAGWAQ